MDVTRFHRCRRDLDQQQVHDGGLGAVDSLIRDQCGPPLTSLQPSAPPRSLPGGLEDQQPGGAAATCRPGPMMMAAAVERGAVRGGPVTPSPGVAAADPAVLSEPGAGEEPDGRVPVR
ncbi:hypothetical protein INR49_020926 [Caranx melampygus]|nr:hypothetical protein INR49_020926 [Caranx melampygus]